MSYKHNTTTETFFTLLHKFYFVRTLKSASKTSIKYEFIWYIGKKHYKIMLLWNVLQEKPLNPLELCSSDGSGSARNSNLNILFIFQTKVPNDEVFEYCLEEENESNLVVCTTRSSSRPTTSSISSTNSSNKKRKRNAWTDWLFPDPVLVPVNIW